MKEQEPEYTFMMTCGHNSHAGKECIANCASSKPLFPVASVDGHYQQVDEYETVGEVLEEIPHVSRMNKQALIDLAMKLGLSVAGNATVGQLRSAIKKAL